MEMGAGDCSRFMHFFTPIFNDEAIGAIAKLQRKTQTRLAHGLVVRLGGSGCPDQACRCRCQRKNGIESSTVMSKYTRMPNFTAGTSGA